MIFTSNLTKLYKEDSNEIKAVDGISLKIEKGDFISIVGPSGSGKTTLLSLLGCLLKPTKGKIIFGEKDLSELTDPQLSQLRQNEIGFIFQFCELISTLNVIENVLLPTMFLRRADLIKYNEKAVELLAEMGLLNRQYTSVRKLSGGEVRRVAIARALINSPKILLADEPTSDLDQYTKQGIVEILSGLNQQGMTIVLVTHDLEVARQAKIRFQMRDGKLKTDAVAKGVAKTTLKGRATNMGVARGFSLAK